MRVLIAEGEPRGHRLYFVRLLVEEAAQRGDVVTLCFSPAVLASVEFATTLKDMDCRVVTEGEPTRPDTLIRRSNEVHSDVTIVLDADRMVSTLARRSRWSGSGVLRLLMLRSRMPRRGADRMHRARVAVKRVLIARVNAMARVEAYHLVPPRADGEYRDQEIGDPVEWRASAEAIQRWDERLSDDLFWFGVFGVVTDRKNLPLVLRVLEAQRHAGREVGLLVAGRMDPTVREALEEFRLAAELVIEVEDRLLDEEELDAGVAAVDCVVLAHSNEGSSGILGKALSSGTRVLAGGALALRDVCEAQPSGAAWAELTETSLGAAASAVLTMPAPAPRGFTSNLADRMLRPPEH